MRFPTRCWRICGQLTLVSRNGLRNAWETPGCSGAKTATCTLIGKLAWLREIIVSQPLAVLAFSHASLILLLLI